MCLFSVFGRVLPHTRAFSKSKWQPGTGMDGKASVGGTIHAVRGSCRNSIGGTIHAVRGSGRSRVGGVSKHGSSGTRSTPHRPQSRQILYMLRVFHSRSQLRRHHKPQWHHGTMDCVSRSVIYTAKRRIRVPHKLARGSRGVRMTSLLRWWSL